MNQNFKHTYLFPYYPYDRTSGGNVVIYTFCHWINKLGGRAYMITQKTAPHLNTPKMLADYPIQDCIVVSPENIDHTQYKGRLNIKYIMADISMIYSKDTSFDGIDDVWSFSKSLYPSGFGEVKTVHIPIADKNIFYDDPLSKRTIYTHYYGRAKACADRDKTKRDSIEITMQYPQYQKELGELFRKSKAFYFHTPSGLYKEAILCGCPAVAIPNERFTKMYEYDEYGDDGLSWGEGNIGHAIDTIHLFQEKYWKLQDTIVDQITKFIEITQKQL